MGDPKEGCAGLAGPLEGIRILELGVFHAGPGACAILGDLGAQVIKIEPREGDPERYWTTVGRMDFSMPNGDNVMFHASNRNKRGICLDITAAEGKDVFARLLRRSDVFLTNLRKSTRTKLGLTYEVLSRIHPEIICATVSGYGPEGPMADLGAFDPLGLARSGLMFVTGGGQPAFLHIGILDQATAITASHAILAALVAKERTGKGQEVHVSLFSAGQWLMYPNLMVSNVLGIDPTNTGERSMHSPLRNFFRCKDGKWVMGTHHPEERYWADFCAATGQNRLLDDPRFSDAPSRAEHCPELVALFDEVFATRTRDAWMEVFIAKKLMFSPIQDVSEIRSDPQAIVNGYVVDFTDPTVGRIKLPGYPAHFSHGRAQTRTLAPRLGEHTDDILKEIGYSEADIARLRDSGGVA